MSATLLQDVAEAVIATIDAESITVDGRTLKTYSHEPKDADYLPAFWLDGPNDIRMLIDELDGPAGSQLGAMDWQLEYEFTLHVRADTPGQGAADARAVMGQIIEALNNDASNSASAARAALTTKAQLGAGITSAALSHDDTVAQTRVTTYRGRLIALSLTATP